MSRNIKLQKAEDLLQLVSGFLNVQKVSSSIEEAEIKSALDKVVQYFKENKAKDKKVDYIHCKSCGHEGRYVLAEYSRVISDGDLWFCPKCDSETLYVDL